MGRHIYLLFGFYIFLGATDIVTDHRVMNVWSAVISIN